MAPQRSEPLTDSGRTGTSASASEPAGAKRAAKVAARDEAAAKVADWAARVAKVAAQQKAHTDAYRALKTKNPDAIGRKAEEYAKQQAADADRRAHRAREDAVEKEAARWRKVLSEIEEKKRVEQVEALEAARVAALRGRGARPVRHRGAVSGLCDAVRPRGRHAHGHVH